MARAALTSDIFCCRAIGLTQDMSHQAFLFGRSNSIQNLMTADSFEETTWNHTEVPFLLIATACPGDGTTISLRLILTLGKPSQLATVRRHSGQAESQSDLKGVRINYTQLHMITHIHMHRYSQLLYAHVACGRCIWTC